MFNKFFLDIRTVCETMW